MTAAGPADQEAMLATRALTAALTGLGDALASLDLDAMLAAEPVLSTALASVTGVQPRLAPVADRGRAEGLANELQAACAALARCARLGASLEEFVRRPGSATATYNAAGAGVLPRMRSGFDQRV